MTLYLGGYVSMAYKLVSAEIHQVWVPFYRADKRQSPGLVGTHGDHKTSASPHQPDDDVRPTGLILDYLGTRRMREGDNYEARRVFRSLHRVFLRRS